MKFVSLQRKMVLFLHSFKPVTRRRNGKTLPISGSSKKHSPISKIAYKSFFNLNNALVSMLISELTIPIFEKCKSIQPHRKLRKKKYNLQISQ